MNFEHLVNNTFPEPTGPTFGYEKPAWKMTEKEVDDALMSFKSKELKNGKLDSEEQYRKDGLIKKKAEFS